MSLNFVPASEPYMMFCKEWLGTGSLVSSLVRQAWIFYFDTACCQRLVCLFVFVWHGAETPDFVASLSLNPLRTVPYIVCYFL
jgi:hypothetical protein